MGGCNNNTFHPNLSRLKWVSSMCRERLKVLFISFSIVCVQRYRTMKSFSYTSALNNKKHKNLNNGA